MRKRMELLNGLAVAALFLIIWGGILISAIRSDAQVPTTRDYIAEACDMYNVCPELIEAMIERESDWNPNAYNNGCIGLMQINAKYHKERMQKLGVTDLTDPEENILVGVDYIAELFEKYEDVYAVLQFYNAGYSEKYGIGAYEKGIYTDYAIEVSERAVELERVHGK